MPEAMSQRTSQTTSRTASLTIAGPHPGSLRPHVDGKFLFVGDEKLYVRGVTYGTFRARWPGDDGYDPVRVDRDLAQMAANGINAVRLYSVPRRWFLDAARSHGLWVLVGIPWEQHVAFLDAPGLPATITRRVVEAIRACAGHPALLGFAIGNEVPAEIVRWHGVKRTERFLEQLCRVVRDEDPDALVTYVNYPSTEYLRPPTADLVAFNVYLESVDDFDAYLGRLQNLAGDQPLLLTEIGLDSRRAGTEAQATLIEGQVRAAFARGAAGAFVYAWTDEWARSDIEVLDWDFGLTTREREPKPALGAVARTYRELPFPVGLSWPRISVVLCSFNGARTIGRCLDGLADLDYPDLEVIVVDDGSTDETAAIVSGYPFRLVRTANQGLSAARNEGLAVATGEIVAYIDDDAWPDRQWLRYLAWTFMTSGHAAVGGPNICPADGGVVASTVAVAPGGPIHILRSDDEAEHIPGCNAAFRVDRLRSISGFDPSFRIAGDDVDVCWRVHERGWTVGFSPGAVVWHRRRDSVRAYARQQRGYGRAEGLLERKWPGRFNRLGHISWPGQLYGPGVLAAPWGRDRVYHGTWGSAAFQSVYQPQMRLSALPLLPEWHLLSLALLLTGFLGLAWSPMFVALLGAAMTAGASLAVAAAAAWGTVRRHPSTARHRVWRRESALLFALIIVQSIARLRGRLSAGLTPWRRRGDRGFAIPRRREIVSWSEDWHSMQARLRGAEERLERDGVHVARGGDYDRWDLEVRVGAFSSARLFATCEEHGGGRQLIRYRVWPHPWSGVLAVGGALEVLAILAALEGAWSVAGVLALLFVVVVARMTMDAASAVHIAVRAVSP